MRRAALRARLRRAVIRLLGRTHVLVYRASGGRVLGRLAGMDVVLLTVTGRRSGKPRTVALTTVPVGDALLLVGSFGGADVAPAWLHNLRADPGATVRRRRATWRVAARVATLEERARLWPLVVATNPGYARYQARTRRTIPIVVLEAAEGDAGRPPQASQASACSASARAGRQTPPRACTDSTKR